MRYFSNRLVHAKLEMNITIQTGASEFSGVPDISIIASTLTAPTKIRLCAIVKCAFTQEIKDLEKKVDTMLDLVPGIIMVICSG